MTPRPVRREDLLHEKRARYGEQIVVTLSQQLTADFGRGFSRHNLSRMLKRAEYFPEQDDTGTRGAWNWGLVDVQRHMCGRFAKEARCRFYFSRREIVRSEFRSIPQTS